MQTTDYPPVVLGPEGLGSYEPPPVQYHEPFRGSMGGPAMPKHTGLGGRCLDDPEPTFPPRLTMWILFGLGLALGAVLARF